MAEGERKKIGKYDVLDVIGRGGMGIVYKAVDPGIGRTVAIKMTTGAIVGDPEMLKRFNREAQSVGNLQHPNIVTVYDLGVDEGNPYLVMELLEGESLESLVRSRPTVSLEEKLDIVVQICNGIQYAHQRNVIHRDIKPANIMILKDGTAKIVDFGIARTGMTKLTRPGQLVGSFQYMSPEQINTTNVDSRTDIFSIGVVLFELVTGKLPFEGKDTGDMLMKILHEPAPSVNALVKNCPPGLDEIVQRALAKDPEQRYQTAEDLALDLGHVLEKFRRERVSEYLQGAETAAAQRQWGRAKEQLLQVLKRDRQNSRATVRLREVQLEIQKQQRSERAKELQAQAEHALAQSDVAEALTYLNEAVELDKSNLEIVQLRDSLQENTARGDRLRDLMQRAELAQDAGDLEEAKRAVEEGLALEPQNTDFRSMQVVVTQEMAGRDKRKRVQEFLGEARKQISLRRFTGALEVLKKAESLDPSVTSVQELIVLASSGQQQEKRRQELERLTAQIEEALVNGDYTSASARIEEGLRSYPDDRGLLKLQAVVRKQGEDTEKSRYIEEQTAQARRLLDGAQAAEALVLLQSALEKYPAEPSLDAMVTLVQQNLERAHKEQERAEVVQRAREAIRRKAYSIAISILEAARKKTTSSEFDELLQFAQNGAENQAKRQRIDAVAEEARRLTAEDKYPEAMALLKATLQEIPDQELEIVLADIGRHVDEFNDGLEKAVAAADRLLRQDRYSEAIKLLEGQSAQYGNVPKFREALENVRQRRREVNVVSILKEEVRNALSKGDTARAKLLCQEFRKSENAPDIALVEREIEAQQAKTANARLEMALRDARLLVTVKSPAAALSVLESVQSAVPFASPDLGRRFEALQTAAGNAIASQRNQPAQPDEKSSSGGVAPADSDEETQLADPDRLQFMLVEVSAIAGNYRDDKKVQSAIYNLKQELTEKIYVLRESSSQNKKRESRVEEKAASPKLPEPTATALMPARSAETAVTNTRVAWLPSTPTPPESAGQRPPAATGVSSLEVATKKSSGATEIPPVQSPPASSSDGQCEDDQREQEIKECLAKANELREAGDMAGASSRIKEALANYPGVPRLIEMQETLDREIEAQRQQERQNDLDELRRMELQATTLTDAGELMTLGARASVLASKYPGDVEASAAAKLVIEKISEAPRQKQQQAEVGAGRPTTPETVEVTKPDLPPAVGTSPPELRPPNHVESVRTPVPTPSAQPPRTIRPAPARRVASPPNQLLKRLQSLDLSPLKRWLVGGGGKIVLGAALAVVVLAIGLAHFIGKKPTQTLPAPATKLLSVRIHTSPSGATIRVNNEVRGVSDLNLDLPTGSYQVEAALNGYQLGKALLDASSGSPNSVDLTLQPTLPMVKLSSDTGAGRVALDDLPPIELAGEQRALEGVAAGDHKLKFEGPQGTASFSFSTSMGIPPAVVGPIAAYRVVAVVVGNLGSRVHVYCSEPNAEASLDDQPSAKLSPDGVELANVPTGSHQLLIKDAGDQYKMAIDVGPAPTLTTFLQSGNNIGTLLVMTREDGVRVSVNGKSQKALTRGGVMRIPNLDPKEYVIAVAKPGFQLVAPQKAAIRKGEQTTVTFILTPLPRVASLSIRGGPPGAQVLLDDKPLGTIPADGTLTVPDISPGDHAIVLRKERFDPKRLQKRFVAGVATEITGSETVLQMSTGELRITFSPPETQVTLTKPGEAPIKVTNGESLNLQPGSYTLVARTADDMTRTKNVEVIAGQSKSVDLPLAPNGMSKWDDPSSWRPVQGSYLHRGGGFVSFGSTPTSGTFSFSAVQKGKRLQWFLNYTAPGNYILFQMDENYFYRSTFRNGAATDEVKMPHKIEKKAFQAIRIRVTPSEIVHQVRVGNAWFVLDRFSSPGTNLALGKFGFYLPGKDEVAIINFNHYPDLDAR
jgi:eukaryotic-like serine/threonine-protein kinase